jgi:hypothetical protein
MEQAAHLDLEPKEPLCGVREPSSCSPRKLSSAHFPLSPPPALFTHISKLTHTH